VTKEAEAVVLAESDFGAWVRLVSESPDGSVYSLPEYLDVLCRAAGGRFHVLAVRHGGELVGGVALYERDSSFGPYVAPRRLLHYNGLVLRRFGTRYPSEQTARHLRAMAALAEALARRGYARATLSCQSSVLDVRALVAAGWTATPQYTYVVDIRDKERLWSRIEQNLRRLIRRCEREGIGVSEDDDFDAFYRLHEETMKRVGAERYLPAGAFHRYFDALRAAGLCRLFHARRPDGRVLASQLVLLGRGDLAHTVAAAADPELLQWGASAFLRWKAFVALAEAGFAGNDLTDASLNPVTHFKSQLGGDLRLGLSLDAPRAWRLRMGQEAATISRRALGIVGRVARRAMARP
jgi:GNAT acetyltransferase-like protein